MAYRACREVFWRFVDHLCRLFIFLASAGGVCVVAAGQDPTGVGWCAASALVTFALEAFAVQGKVGSVLPFGYRAG